jgi:hypothetical protein
MKLDLNLTRRQLWLMTAESDPVMDWQVFCDYDHGRKDLARSYRGTLSEMLPDLTRAQRQGCGVFTAVHEFDGFGRRKENFMAIRALFLDFDSAPLPDHWPIVPDLVLNTSPGKHQCIWTLNEARTEVPLWRCLQRSLQERYGADKHCRGNVCQVMRVAGFQHMKDRSQPHTVRIVHAAARYREETDYLQAWIDSHCELDPDARTLQVALYDDHLAFLSAQRMKPLSNKAFGSQLMQKGFERERSRNGQIVHGLKLRA